jgi:hypothetical protein
MDKVARHIGQRAAAEPRRHTSMHLERLLMLIGFAPLICDCAMHDGAFVYNVDGRLISENSTPLGGRSMYVQLEPFVPADTHLPEAVLTEPNGHFSQDAMTGVAWGYRSIFGIPLGWRNPPAPPVEVIYIAVERAPGSWVHLELPLSPAQQPRPAAVHLGDVRVNE